MELTLDQALQKGVQAHETGKVQEADRYYTAIIKANPKHPDANHNMGVLAVGLGKVEEALPFFKTALQANSSIAQYWLSYIDAFIKLDRIEDAKAVFDRAKGSGIEGDGFDKLKERLTSQAQLQSRNQDPSQDQLQPLINLYNQEESQRVLLAAENLLNQYPYSGVLHNMIGAANQRLGKLDEAIEAYTRVLSIQPDFADSYNNMGVALKEQGRIDEAIDAYNKALSIQPDFSEAYNNMGNALNKLGKHGEAIEVFNKALSIKPDNAESYNNLGNALQKQGKIDEAIEAYKKALSIKPNFSETYKNMGNALEEQSKLEQAIEAYNKALSIQPDYAESYNNMGVSLQKQGKLDEAIEAYNKALSIQPKYAEANKNMGIALNEQGKLDEAIDAYYSALKIKPDYPEVYNNLGITLNEQGKLDEAIEAHKKALAIKPDYTEVYWNLYGTAESIREAKSWLEKCLVAEPNHLKAKLTLSALKLYEGDEANFNEVIKSSPKDNPLTRSIDWVFSLPKLPPLYFHRWALFDHMTNLSKKDRPFYEFGVWRGEAFRYLIKTFKKGYGFDTFEGLPEDWHNEKAGTYSSGGNVPKIKGGNFIVGKFEDTLPEFFAEKRPKASIINFDADLYSSTICALNFAKPVIDKHTILIFDEFFMNKNWEQDEYKALEEFCSKNNYTYEVLAISFFTKQVAVKIIGI